MIKTYSHHKIDSEESFGFSPSDYSKFKFGFGSVAHQFGEALAKGFIKNVLSKRENIGQMVIFPSPYDFIPTATFPLKNQFIYTLNYWLVQNGFPVAEESKIHRNTTYREDYGEMDAAERMSLISNDTFHIDREFTDGKELIFIDDIKITGGHERMIIKMIKEYRLLNTCHLLYFAELVNPDIHPRIENHLNYYAIKSIFDLDEIINDPSFCFNTRFIKYILNYEHDAFKVFIENQSFEFCLMLYNQAIGNNYHRIDAYSQNLEYFTETIFLQKQTKTIKNGN